MLVNVNPAYRRSELEYAMNKVECKALVLAPALKTSNYLEITDDLVKAGKLPHLRHIVRLGPEKTPGMLNFDDVATAGGNAEKMKLADLGPKLQFDDAINIQFTSGTTGHPKGATLSHHNILNNGYFVGEGLKLTPDDRLCIPVPLYHCFGMVMGNLGCLTHGATMVYPAEAFDPLATLQAVAEERCTALYGVPTMFIAQLDHPEFAKFDLRSLRTGIMAGSPCPDRGDEEGAEPDEHGRGHHRLRHDRDLARLDAMRHRRSGGAARLDGGPGACRTSRSRSSIPRARRCRAARPASSAPAAIR